MALTSNAAISGFIMGQPVETDNTHFDFIMGEPYIIFNGTVGGEPPVDTCSCPTINTNWAVDMDDKCVISSPCDIGNGNLTFDTSTGYFNVSSTITLTHMEYPVTNQIVYMKSGGTINIG